MEYKLHYIQNVIPDSIADQLGVESGDFLVSINNKNIIDVLDYMDLTSATKLDVYIKKKSGEEWILDVEKDPEEDLGMEFDPPLMAEHKSCRNKCIFCFIDQLPPHMRSSLYYKDDDWRLSFLMGNYITLTNLSDEEVERIIALHISPLYVSVHTTNGQLRKKMMNNKNADKILTILERFKTANIKINCQIVLCPDWNDGINLDHTIEDLWEFKDIVQSVAVVPVGLTKYRCDLTTIRPFDRKAANNVINQVKNWQSLFIRKENRRFIFVADEFYILAGREFPEYGFYGDFPQIDNGVGLVTKFKYEFYKALHSLPKADLSERKISIVTGVSAYNIIRKLSDEVSDKFGIGINVFAIKNDFFGEQVTVAGLVTGGDIIKGLKGQDLSSKVIIPNVMLRQGQTVFLDNISLEDIEKALEVHVVPVEVNGYDFLDNILN